MKALVVYESLFGNTEQIAQAVTRGLSRKLTVELAPVRTAPPVVSDSYDLVVVGGPTHAFSMTRASTREDAGKQGAERELTLVGIREWLTALEVGPHTGLVATFDTRVDRVRKLPGSAAKAAAKSLRHTGYHLAAKPVSFYVEDTMGPLLPGELDRAEEWGLHLGEHVAAHRLSIL